MKYAATNEKPKPEILYTASELASALQRLRWAGMTAEERSRQMSRAVLIKELRMTKAEKRARAVRNARKRWAIAKAKKTAEKLAAKAARAAAKAAEKGVARGNS